MVMKGGAMCFETRVLSVPHPMSRWSVCALEVGCSLPCVTFALARPSRLLLFVSAALLCLYFDSGWHTLQFPVYLQM